MNSSLVPSVAGETSLLLFIEELYFFSYGHKNAVKLNLMNLESLTIARRREVGG